MYSDILDQVAGASGSGGRAGGGRSGGRGTRNHGSSSVAANDDANTEIVVRFKAGRIQLQNLTVLEAANNDNPAISDTDDDTTTATTLTSIINSSNKENKFHCVARPERGEVRLVKTTSSSSSSQYPTTYAWQWYNRTTESVHETIQLLPSTTSTSSVKDVINKFERITLPNKRMYELDRVYVWTQIPSKKDPSLQQKPIYKMYWMQDADPTTDENIVSKVQQYFAEVVTAAITAEQAAAAASTNNASGTGTTPSANQVDALSSILENLGMPQTSTSSNSVDAPPGGATTSTSSTRNQLTLADLQGAMASIQQQQQQVQQQTTTVGPPLQDLVNTQAIDAIMNNPESCQRLIQFLPPDQQSIEYLRDNLTSSSMQSTLRTLTQMLVQTDDDDDANANGDIDPTMYSEYNNIIANFQLDPIDGEMALLQNNNPIEAFLRCIIASVEREKQQAASAATTEEVDMEDAETKPPKEDDDDVNMNE